MTVIATAGHVDHGKTTLVKALTGTDTDRLPDERRKGVSIDLGFAEFRLSSELTISIVDVPGHQRFVRNMLAGLGGIQGCLFVVAADEGWMPQSQEHLEVINLLGIDRGVIALSRADLADNELIEVATQEILEHVKGTTLEHATIVPVSAVKGRGITSLRREVALMVRDLPSAPNRGRPRLWIDRTFSIRGAGTVVTGTLTDGCFELDERVEVHPNESLARIRGIQSHGASLEVAHPGNRIALNLARLKPEEASRGMVVTRPRQWKRADVLGVRLSIVREDLELLTSRGAYVLHIGSADSAVRCRFDPPSLSAGSQGFGILKLPTPLVVGIGDRFILRDTGRSMVVAGGEVLYASERGHARPASRLVLRELHARADKQGEDLLLHVLQTKEFCTVLELGQETGKPLGEVTASIEGFVKARKAILTGEMVVAADYWRRMETGLLSFLTAFHRDEPARVGVPKELVLTKSPQSRRLMEACLGKLIEAEKVITQGPLVALARHEPVIPEQDQQMVSELTSLLEGSGARPPRVSELEARGFARSIIELVIERGDAVRIEPDIVMGRDALRTAVRLLISLMERLGPTSVGEARDALKSSRQYVMPLLYFLDAQGVTRRVSDKRAVGPGATKFLEELGSLRFGQSGLGRLANP